EQRGPERTDGGELGRVEGQLDLDDGTRLRGDALLPGDVADATGEVEVPAGHPADVVADERKVDVRVAERDVRVVVGLLRELGDGGDEPQPGGERLRAEARVQCRGKHPPVGEPGVEDLLTGERGHGPRWHAQAPRARPPVAAPGERWQGRRSHGTDTEVPR